MGVSEPFAGLPRGHYGEVSIRRLSTGYWHIRGKGPCEWTQPPEWPCAEKLIRDSAFPQASEQFLRAVVRLANAR